jgi:hypothetical protein
LPGPDNAAVELVDEGVNVVAGGESPEGLAAIVGVHDRGEALRASTASWFDRNRDALDIEGSLRTELAAYAR